ncbi:hypothetical protein CAI18_23505 (plasmid) [Xanthomonas citri pv. punicae]|nr:hypothetical protein CAI14_23570 [Xanthomonas citri pv. punicae]QCZ71461.1 hypothetical protein CAI17_23065 [Xanthomonas citri pv. punicae]QCZ79641.1 hypothetical protein XapA_23250 [Xanthomonas citri pv. punicae]QCZ83731.1 hypothetical protein XapB_23575 [Xanthomonas citri pv. punicae]QCZ87884.1 hypothetical protein CAI18_23505 [Xanthomonas citri pv. punicae]
MLRAIIRKYITQLLHGCG